MTLISCPECQRKISDQAQSCPQCGYPLAKRSRADFEFPFQKPMNELADRIANALHEIMRPPSDSRPSEDKETTKKEEQNQTEKTSPDEDENKRETP
jgi:hypothetical protein